MTRIDWSKLRQEVRIWGAEGRALPVWWRDDDASEPTEKLDLLAAVAEQSDMSVSLAVIPAFATSTLAAYVAQSERFLPVVHGWSHQNHAPEGQKSAEFGHPRIDAADELAQGMTTLQALFGSRLFPMFVPPWNRLSDSYLSDLKRAGFGVVSTYGPRSATWAIDGICQINTHVDPVDWRGTRGLADTNKLLNSLIDILQARRNGAQSNAEPLGLLTHHLMQDDATWDFCTALLSELREISYPYDFITESGDSK